MAFDMPTMPNFGHRLLSYSGARPTDVVATPSRQTPGSRFGRLPGPTADTAALWLLVAAEFAALFAIRRGFRFDIGG